MTSRFRVEDEEDLHWKLMSLGTIGVSDGHSIFHGVTGARARDFQVLTRGVEYGDQGQYDQAIAEFTKCLQVDPRFDLAHYNRGIAYARRGQPDLAIVDFTKFIEIGLSSSLLFRALHSRGVAYTQKGQYDKALADFEKALKLNPQDAELSI